MSFTDPCMVTDDQEEQARTSYCDLLELFGHIYPH